MIKVIPDVADRDEPQLTDEQLAEVRRRRADPDQQLIEFDDVFSVYTGPPIQLTDEQLAEVQLAKEELAGGNAANPAAIALIWTG